MYAYFFVSGKSESAPGRSRAFSFRRLRVSQRSGRMGRRRVVQGRNNLHFVSSRRSSGCASYGPGKRQIHSYFCDLRRCRKANPGAARLALSETLIFLSRPHACLISSRCLIVSSSIPVGSSVGLFPCIFLCIPTRWNCHQVAFQQGSWYGTRQDSLVFPVFGFFCFDFGPRDAGIGSLQRLFCMCALHALQSFPLVLPALEFVFHLCERVHGMGGC